MADSLPIKLQLRPFQTIIVLMSAGLRVAPLDKLTERWLLETASDIICSLIMNRSSALSIDCRFFLRLSSSLSYRDGGNSTI
jgi:hypothetical protein